MSLLLEALKKAEKAKDDAKRRAEGGADAESGLGFAGAAGAGDKHVVTRNELPDISQPMDIVSEDFAPGQPAARHAAEAAPVPIELAPEPAPRRAPPLERTPAPVPTDAGRAGAKNLVEAT